MGEHLIDGEFQSDKYPTTPRGKVPLSVKDKTAQDLLWLYAQRRRPVDAGFSDDLETALRSAGFEPSSVSYAILDTCIAVVKSAAWKHAGEDAHSQGMDAGARHQLEECLKAIYAIRGIAP